jgi:hypothetical protein
MTIPNQKWVLTDQMRESCFNMKYKKALWCQNKQINIKVLKEIQDLRSPVEPREFTALRTGYDRDKRRPLQTQLNPLKLNGYYIYTSCFRRAYLHPGNTRT